MNSISRQLLEVGQCQCSNNMTYFRASISVTILLYPCTIYIGIAAMLT